MKTRILLLAATVLTLGSCSTVYKSGQTPDDVYYSPGVEQSGYANSDRNAVSDDGYVDLDDRYLRMKSSSRRRWSSFDDDFMYWNNPMWNNQFMFNSWNRPMGGFWNSPFLGGMGMGWGMGMGPNFGFNPFFGNGMFFDPFWNRPMMGFNSFYGNPFSPFYFGTPVVVVNHPLKPVSNNPRANGPRTYNLGTYNPSGSGYIDPRNGKNIYSTPSGSGRTGIRVFSNTGANNSGRSSGYIETNSSRPRGGYNESWNNGGGRGSSSPSRTFDSPSSGGSRMGGGGTISNGGGGAPVRSFPRGGGN